MAFEKLPKAQRKRIGDAIRKSVFEGVRLARVQAPVDTGALQRGIHAKFQVTPNAFVGSVEAAPPDKASQIKALAVEFGRSYPPKRSRRSGAKTMKSSRKLIFTSAGSRDTGETQPVPFMRRTQQILGAKHANRVRYAMRKAAQEVGFK